MCGLIGMELLSFYYSYLIVHRKKTKRYALTQIVYLTIAHLFGLGVGVVIIFGVDAADSKGGGAKIVTRLIFALMFVIQGGILLGWCCYHPQRSYSITHWTCAAIICHDLSQVILITWSIINTDGGRYRLSIAIRL